MQDVVLVGQVRDDPSIRAPGSGASTSIVSPASSVVAVVTVSTEADSPAMPGSRAGRSPNEMPRPANGPEVDYRYVEGVTISGS